MTKAMHTQKDESYFCGKRLGYKLPISYVYSYMNGKPIFFVVLSDILFPKN